jgi:hydrogenase expression/formation protein HypC
MCLAVPMEIVKIDGDVADVAVAGVTRQVRLDLMPEKAEIGDYVIVHAGFALNRLNREEALETIKLFQQVLSLDINAPE